MSKQSSSALSIADAVADLLAEVTGVEEVRTAPDLRIRELGILDSLGVINLIVGLSEKLGVEVSPSEIEESDIATPAAVAGFVAKKLAARAS